MCPRCDSGFIEEVNEDSRYSSFDAQIVFVLQLETHCPLSCCLKPLHSPPDGAAGLKYISRLENILSVALNLT